MSIKISEDQDLLHSLLSLPQKIVQHHDVDGLAQMVLHDLGHQSNFAFKKAIFLADNPDFDHLVGVAGYDKNECHLHGEDLWSDPRSFSARMANAFYHNDVMSFLRSSFKRHDHQWCSKEDIEKIGKEMGLEQPQFLSWDLKHGNHGLLIFDHEDSSRFDLIKHKLLSSAVSILGFCSFR